MLSDSSKCSTRATALAVLLSLVWLQGCDAIKKAFSPPAPVAVVAVLDRSASFEQRVAQASGLIFDLNNRLEPQKDHVGLFRVGASVDWLYSGVRPAPGVLRAQLETYAKVARQERGTAYSDALGRAAREAAQLAERYARVAVLVTSDGANEPSPASRSVSWRAVGRSFRSLPANVSVFMLFLPPKLATEYRDRFTPLLGERFKPYNEQATRPGFDELMSFLER
jgi:hypothetical protein